MSAGSAARGWGVVSAALLSLLLAAGSGRAQGAEDYVGWAFDGRSGLALPAAELAELSSPGPTVGLGVTYWVTPRVGVRVDGDLDLLTSTRQFGPLEEKGPAFRAWHSTAGAVWRFTNEDAPRWTTVFGLGAGAVTFDSDPFLVPVTTGTTPFQFEDTYFTSYARLRIGYEVNRWVRLFFGARSHLIIANEDATEVFSVATGGRVEPFTAVWSFPLIGGISVGI